MNMDLVARCGDRTVQGKLQPYYVPRNFSLLFFNPNPHKFFRGAKIEIGRYSRDDDVIEEIPLSGPIDQQIRQCLSYILQHTQEEVSYACVTYPERALREAVVNAVYHRGYEADHCDPIKVHMRPDCIEIISYPGPHPSLKPEHFRDGTKRPSVPARNRRIGNHLKQLKLAEARYTGVNTIFKTMKRNENATPSFDFDASYFQVTLPGHPKYITRTLLSDAENLIAKGEKKEAVALLLEFLDHQPDMYSPVLFLKLVELHDGNPNHPDIQKHAVMFLKTDKKEVELLRQRIPLLKKLRLWVSGKPLDVEAGVPIVKKLVQNGSTLEELQTVVQTAVAYCRPPGNERIGASLENLQNGHKLFEAMGSTIVQSSEYVAFEYACCKYNIFNASVQQIIGTRRNLLTYLQDAQEYVTKAMQLTDKENKSYLAKHHRQLGYIKFELLPLKKATVADVLECYSKARELNPQIHINKFSIPEEGRWMYRSPTSSEKERT